MFLLRGSKRVDIEVRVGISMPLRFVHHLFLQYVAFRNRACKVISIPVPENVFSLREVNKPKSNHNTNSDTQLLQRNQTPSDIRWRQFSEIKWHNHTQLSNSQPSNESSNKNHRDIHRCCLYDGTDEENDIC